MSTRHMRQRLKSGRRTHKAPWSSLVDWLLTLLCLMSILSAYLFVANSDAEAGMDEAQAQQIRAEVALITLVAKIEAYEGDK